MLAHTDAHAHTRTQTHTLAHTLMHTHTCTCLYTLTFLTHAYSHAHACTRSRTCSHTHAHMLEHTHNAHKHTLTCTHVHMHTCTHSRNAHTHTHMLARTRMHTRAHTCTCSHTHAHTHIHTCTHSRTHNLYPQLQWPLLSLSLGHCYSVVGGLARAGPLEPGALEGRCTEGPWHAVTAWLRWGSERARWVQRQGWRCRGRPRFREARPGGDPARPASAAWPRDSTPVTCVLSENSARLLL